MIKLAVSADLVTLTEKMRNVKLHFFFAVLYRRSSFKYFTIHKILNKIVTFSNFFEKKDQRT